ncbi:hypothetical protein FQB35_04990 [Crassaminicella thermophila]|uniref:Uncharacterized protein n=1 Tax=Crassaminicella thermophila TaxID=2599308 RepID=A0A5C0SB11_CRATE|nr:hypothetical protein [Crassaminicella thermophila]QEK11773.1 hypothetical protein FQB35_04990 [Crassaminicella thermophila]
MNELIPVDSNDILLPEDEISIGRFPIQSNRMFIFIIPIFLILFLKNKNTYSNLSSENYEKPKTPTINSNTLDKISHLLENVKKATVLNDLRKSAMQSNRILGSKNLEFLKEALNVFGSNMSEETKSHIQTATTILSILDKVKDVKNILNIQKALNFESNKDMSAQINNIIEAIEPMLPAEYAKKIGDFKKMAQMMKLMSLFNDDEDLDEEEDNNISDSYNNDEYSDTENNDENDDNPPKEE